MSSDPIVQCGQCGAKLKLKAATLKVMKQIRCGKCQAKIDIATALKAADEAGNNAPVAPLVANDPNKTSSAAQTTADAAPSGPESTDAASSLPTQSALQEPTVPASTPSSSASTPEDPNDIPAEVPAAEDVDRIQALERKVAEQQFTIEQLGRQVQRLIQLSIEASTSCLSTFSSRKQL